MNWGWGKLQVRLITHQTNESSASESNPGTAPACTSFVLSGGRAGWLPDYTAVLVCSAPSAFVDQAFEGIGSFCKGALWQKRAWCLLCHYWYTMQFIFSGFLLGGNWQNISSPLQHISSIAVNWFYLFPTTLWQNCCGFLLLSLMYFGISAVLSPFYPFVTHPTYCSWLFCWLSPAENLFWAPDAFPAGGKEKLQYQDASGWCSWGLSDPGTRFLAGLGGLAAALGVVSILLSKWFHAAGLFGYWCDENSVCGSEWSHGAIGEHRDLLPATAVLNPGLTAQGEGLNICKCGVRVLSALIQALHFCRKKKKKAAREKGHFHLWVLSVRLLCSSASWKHELPLKIKWVLNCFLPIQ